MILVKTLRIEKFICRSKRIGAISCFSVPCRERLLGIVVGHVEGSLVGVLSRSEDGDNARGGVVMTGFGEVSIGWHFGLVTLKEGAVEGPMSLVSSAQ